MGIETYISIICVFYELIMKTCLKRKKKNNKSAKYIILDDFYYLLKFNIFEYIVGSLKVNIMHYKI